MLNEDEQLKHANNIYVVLFKDAKLQATVSFSSQPENSIHLTCPKFSKNLARFRKFKKKASMKKYIFNKVAERNRCVTKCVKESNRIHGFCRK